jgi:hypothetical protein
MATAFLLRFQELLRDGEEPVVAERGLGQIPHANTELTVTEVSGEEPRRDPKKPSCAVFPN